MASARIINYILCRRFITVSSRTNMDVFPHFVATPCTRQNVWYCTQKSVIKVGSDKHQNKLQLNVVEVVKQNTKSVGYFGVIIIGLGLTGLMFYVICFELFSSKSPYSVYDKALNRCIKDPRVADLLGEPIKAYGKKSRRGYQSYISHVKFSKDGIEHMKMKFYIQGIRKRGTVYLEVQENESGNYEYTYLHVIVDDITQTFVKLEDKDESKSYNDGTEFDLN